MIVLDTNVISEVLRPVPDERVELWLLGLPADEAAVAAPTVAELYYGIEQLPQGRKRDGLQLELKQVLDGMYVLPFDEASALIYSKLAAERRRAGRPVQAIDCQIASVAISAGAVVATRNVLDFTHEGLELINPWET